MVKNPKNQNQRSVKGKKESRRNKVSPANQPPRSEEKRDLNQETSLLRVRLQDGNEAGVGDEVTISGWNARCEGIIFVIFEIVPYEHCASGCLLKVHVKGDKEKVLKSIGVGFDPTWFKKSMQ